MLSKIVNFIFRSSNNQTILRNFFFWYEKFKHIFKSDFDNESWNFIMNVLSEQCLNNNIFCMWNTIYICIYIIGFTIFFSSLLLTQVKSVVNLKSGSIYKVMLLYEIITMIAWYLVIDKNTFHIKFIHIYIHLQAYIHTSLYLHVYIHQYMKLHINLNK